MVVGHTKFSPDWCFGLLKQRLRRCELHCLDDIVREVERSADVNFAQLVGTQSGETLVPMYDWSTFFHPHFKVLPHIKKYHHFILSKNCTGVTVKEYSDSDPTTINILTTKWTPNFNHLPSVIKPTGLTEERRTYLYNNIREFCKEDLRDSVFPPPSSVLQNSQSSTCSPPCTPQFSSTIQSSTATPKKRARVCSRCGEEGHNKRTCHT